MLIKFNEIVNKYGRPEGIIHIGAHLLEERNDYITNGLQNLIWIEANPKIYFDKNLLNKNNLNEKFFNFAISNIDNEIIDLNITNNSQASSILELEKVKIHHPQIFVIETIKVKTKRMDTLIFENNVDIKNYDFLNIDIQGAELLALKSFGNLLNNMKYIYTEINTSELYKGCALIDEIDSYLSNFNFKRVETFMTEYEWGDALYIKE